MRPEITEFTYTYLLMDLIYFCHVNIYKVFFSTFQCPYCIYICTHVENDAFMQRDKMKSEYQQVRSYVDQNFDFEHL